MPKLFSFYLKQILRYTLDVISFGVYPPFTKMHENEGEGLIQMLVKSDIDMILTDQGFHLKEE